MTEGEKTKEEKRREVALKNLKSSKLIDIAAAYLVHESGQYGEVPDSAMEQFKYLPAFSSGTKAYSPDGEEYDVVRNAILASRESGKRYTGNVSELGIMKSCNAIMNESLNAVTISDIMGLMGSKAELKERGNAYVNDLVSKLSKEELEKLPEEKKKAIVGSAQLYQTLVSGYVSYLTQKKVSEALSESAKQIPKNLEKILTESSE